MKFSVVVLFLFGVGFVSAKSIEIESSEVSPVYGYLTKYGIARAEQIQKAEEEYLRNPDTRIVGGSPSSLGKFKYQAGLLIDIIGQTGRGVCGGSLIRPNRVVTAAHCVFDGSNQAWRFTVVLGSTLLFSGGTRIQTSNFQVHPRWMPLLIRNDVAIIRLSSNVPLSDTIATIALPTGTLSTENFVDEIATASGFGLTSDGGNIYNNQTLSYVSMPVISNEDCLKTYPRYIQPSNICTKTTGGTSTCNGDSGGPLTVERNGNPVLIGITSFGSVEGCSEGYDAAFVRVTSYLTFINKHL